MGYNPPQGTAVAGMEFEDWILEYVKDLFGLMWSAKLRSMLKKGAKLEVIAGDPAVVDCKAASCRAVRKGTSYFFYIDSAPQYTGHEAKVADLPPGIGEAIAITTLLTTNLNCPCDLRLVNPGVGLAGVGILPLLATADFYVYGGGARKNEGVNLDVNIPYPAILFTDFAFHTAQRRGGSIITAVGEVEGSPLEVRLWTYNNAASGTSWYVSYQYIMLAYL